MNVLWEKQRSWIAYRDRTANAEGAEFAGGSVEPLALHSYHGNPDGGPLL